MPEIDLKSRLLLFASPNPRSIQTQLIIDAETITIVHTLERMQRALHVWARPTVNQHGYELFVPYSIVRSDELPGQAC
jgi:hypothetical protein